MGENERNFITSFVKLRSSIYRYISRFVPPSDVEDIVQDAYVKLCSIEDKDPQKYNKSFFYTVAKNLALDHLKRAENKLSDSLDEDDTELDVDGLDTAVSSAITFERFGQFCSIVQSMPKQCRKVFVLRKVYGFTQQEIAEKLDISISTVSNHLVKGTKLFSQYAQHEGQPLAESVKHASKGG